MKTKSFCGCLGLSLLFFLAFNQGFAQVGSTGRIVGTVQDPTGAMISGATVVVTNTGTSQERRRSTDSVGGYIIADLTPGKYDIMVENAGFVRYVQKGVI